VAIKHGDVIVTATAGDFCPITSHLLDAPLFRLTLKPTSGNGLKTESQLMIDKLTTVKRERIGKRIGQLSLAPMTKVGDALRMWLELGNTV
jgi:mRNA interferase MazF